MIWPILVRKKIDYETKEEHNFINTYPIEQSEQKYVTDDQKYNCNFCDKSFIMRQLRNNHETKGHSVVRDESCEEGKETVKYNCMNLQVAED